MQRVLFYLPAREGQRFTEAQAEAIIGRAASFNMHMGADPIDFGQGIISGARVVDDGTRMMIALDIPLQT